MLNFFFLMSSHTAKTAGLNLFHQLRSPMGWGIIFFLVLFFFFLFINRPPSVPHPTGPPLATNASRWGQPTHNISHHRPHPRRKRESVGPTHPTCNIPHRPHPRCKRESVGLFPSTYAYVHLHTRMLFYPTTGPTLAANASRWGQPIPLATYPTGPTLAANTSWWGCFSLHMHVLFYTRSFLYAFAFFFTHSHSFLFMYTFFCLYYVYNLISK